MINVGILAKMRQMHFRDGMSLREVAKRTGLSRNTIRRWLRQPDVTEPIYPPRKSPSKVDAWAELLVTWLKTDSRRVKRERGAPRQPYLKHCAPKGMTAATGECVPSSGTGNKNRETARDGQPMYRSPLR